MPRHVLYPQSQSQISFHTLKINKHTCGWITLFEFDSSLGEFISSLGEFIYSNLPLLNIKIKIKECLF